VPGYEPGGREFESLRAHHYTETAGPGLLFFYVCFSAGLRPAPADASSQGNGNSKSWHSVGWRGDMDRQDTP
ncbi:hypothetical protein, partial [Stenotrophomonas sp. DR009]|uniref:hypothetical protein n=1 Tax=Stenotrophomonas sp. DR009 TaxID=3398461 RepID=UPI003BB1B2A2